MVKKYENFVKKIIFLPLDIFLQFDRNISDYFGSLKVKKYSHSSKIIRISKDDDIDKIFEIYELGFYDKNPNWINQIIKYNKLFRNTFYVYEINGEVVGYIGYYVHLKRVGMKFVQQATNFSGCVDRQMRGRGIYTILLSESLNELKKNNVQAVFAFINVNNTLSLSVHKKLGFKIIQAPNFKRLESNYLVELILDN